MIPSKKYYHVKIINTFVNENDYISKITVKKKFMVAPVFNDLTKRLTKR